MAMVMTIDALGPTGLAGIACIDTITTDAATPADNKKAGSAGNAEIA